MKEPSKVGWIKQWTNDLKENPPDMTKSKIKNIVKYIYFEKDIYNLDKKNYLL